MHVFLTNGKQKKLLMVDLVDGYIPSLIGYSGKSNITNNLEPASWFKVMVIESISIDCEKNIVCWTINSSDASTGKEHTMFDDVDQNYYDFDDDLDELYQLALFLVRTNPMSVLNERDRHDLIEEYERSLFRLLHCYILDKIKLHPEDVAQVERAFDKQLQAIALLEDAILMHRRLAEQSFIELRELQESRILPFFHHIVANGGCTKQTISLLRENVSRDLRKITSDVDVAQRKVDQVKLSMNQGATSKDFANTLATARGKRDILVAKMHQLLEWREMLSMQEKNLKVIDVNGPTEPVFLQYMEIYEKFQAEKMAANELVDKKVRAASVRVSIETSLKDLRKGKESIGEGIATDGHKPTDVIMDEGSNTEWKTLGGRLASILHNADHPNGKRFLDFTSNIKQKCHQIFRTYEQLLETRSVADVEGFFIVGHQNVDFEQELREINSEIMDHLEHSSALLMEYFQKGSQMFWRKLRLCYERYFFNEVGDYLIRLYRIVNGNVMLDLEKRVTRLKDLPVCSLGLQMKNEWWLSLFDPISVYASPSYDEKASCSTDYVDVYDGCCSDHGDNGNCGDSGDHVCDNERYLDDQRMLCENHSCDEDLTMIGRDDSSKCYKNVDLMREKLQTGAAKVLSRSWSELSIVSDKNIVRFGANLMTNEINSKVANNLHLIPHRKVFGSFKKENRSLTTYNATNLDQSHRNRSVSTPNFLNSEFKRRESESDRISSPSIANETLPLNRRDSFNRHFGEVIKCIRGVFKSSNPLSKGQCLTESLSKMVQKVAKLRSRDHPGASNEAAFAVSAEDLLPLLVLMFLKLKPEEVAKLYVEMCFVSDLLVDFLSSGCHSYALTVFQTAFRVLSQVFDELDFP